jgi:hypothetical protein
MACSDCRIDFQTTIYVCPSCRDRHEEKCSASVRARAEKAEAERLSMELTTVPLATAKRLEAERDADLNALFDALEEKDGSEETAFARKWLDTKKSLDASQEREKIWSDAVAGFRARAEKAETERDRLALELAEAKSIADEWVVQSVRQEDALRLERDGTIPDTLGGEESSQPPQFMLDAMTKAAFANFEPNNETIKKASISIAMAPGCCSAISPCGHQQRDPTTICDLCRQALESTRLADELRAKGHRLTAEIAAMRSVCDEIVMIMRTYREQEAAGSVDTPGGLEHMGDVWKQLSEWDETIRKAR